MEEGKALTTLPDEETLVGDNEDVNWDSDTEASQGYNKVKFHSAKMDLSLKILKEELVGLKHSGDSLSRKVATMFRTFNEMKDSGALSDVSDVEFEYESDEESQTTNPSSAGSLEDDEDYLLGDRSRELRRESCPANSLDSGYYSRASDSSYGRPMRPGTLFISPPISGEEDNSGDESHTSSEEEENEISHHSRCSCCPPSPTNSISSAGSFCSSRSSSTSSLSDSSDDEVCQQGDGDVMGTQSSQGAGAERKVAMEQLENETDGATSGESGASKPWRPRRLSPVYEQSQGSHDTGSAPFIPTLVFKRSGNADEEAEEPPVEAKEVHLSTIEESLDELPSPVDSDLSERRSPDGSAADNDVFEQEPVKTEIEVATVTADVENEAEAERKSVQQLRAAFQKMENRSPKEKGHHAHKHAKKDKQATAEKKDVPKANENEKGKSAAVQKTIGNTESEDRTTKPVQSEKKSERKKSHKEEGDKKEDSNEHAPNQEGEENQDEKVLPVAERRKLFDRKTTGSPGSLTVPKKHVSKKHTCPVHHNHHTKEKTMDKRKEVTAENTKKGVDVAKSSPPRSSSGNRKELVESRYQEVEEPDKETLAAQVKELKNWWKSQQEKKDGVGGDKQKKGEGVTQSRLLDELSRSRNYTPSAEFLSKNEELIALQPVYSRVQYGKPGSRPKRVIVIPSLPTPTEEEARTIGGDQYVKMSPVLSRLQQSRAAKEAGTAECPSPVAEGYKLMGPVRGSTKPSRPEITSKIRQRKTREPCRVANIISPDDDSGRVVCMQPVRSQVYRREKSLPPDMRLESDNPAFTPLTKRPDIARRWSFTPEENRQKDYVSQKRRHCVGSDPYATGSALELPVPKTPSKQKAGSDPRQPSSAAKIVLSAKPDKVQGLFKELQQMDDSQDKEQESAPSTPQKTAQYGNFVFVKENRVKQMPDGTTKDSKCLKIVVKSKKKQSEADAEKQKEKEPEKAAVAEKQSPRTENTEKRVTTTFTTEIGGVQSPSTYTPLITREVPILMRDTPIFTGNVPIVFGDIPIITRDVSSSSFSFDIPVITGGMSTTTREIPITVNRQVVPMTSSGAAAVHRQQSTESHTTTSYRTRIENPGGGNVIVIRRQKCFEPRPSRVITNFQIEVPGGQRIQRHYEHQETRGSGQPSTHQLGSGQVKSTYRYTFDSS